MPLTVNSIGEIQIRNRKGGGRKTIQSEIIDPSYGKVNFKPKDLLCKRIVNFYLTNYYFTDRPCNGPTCKDKDKKTTYGAAYGRKRPKTTRSTLQYGLPDFQREQAENAAWQHYVKQEKNEDLRYYYSPLASKLKRSICKKVPEPPKVPDNDPDESTIALEKQLSKLNVNSNQDQSKLNTIVENHLLKSGTRRSKISTSTHWAVQRVRESEDIKVKREQDLEEKQKERERLRKIAMAADVSEAKVKRDRLWAEDFQTVGLVGKRKYIQHRPMPINVPYPSDYDRLYPYGKSAPPALYESRLPHRCCASRRHFPSDSRLGWLLCQNPAQQAKRG